MPIFSAPFSTGSSGADQARLRRLGTGKAIDDMSKPTGQSSYFISHGTKIEQMRDRERQEATPEDGHHHVQASPGRQWEQAMPA
jgi:hypothetical protein